MKLISLAPDLSNFKLYDTSLARAIATCGTPCAQPAGRRHGRGPAREVHRRQPAAVGRGRLRPRGGRRRRRGHLRPAGPRPRAGVQPPGDRLHPRATLQPDTDLAMVGYPFTDEVSHQFMGLVSPTDPDGEPNPCYDVTPEVRRRPRARARRRRTASRSARSTSAARTSTRTRSSATSRELMRRRRQPADDVRGLRPRLRAAVVRGQRERGAECRDGRRRLAAREQRERLELQRRRRRARRSADRAERGGGHHEGVLGRRDDPDLHQPEPAQERRAADLVVVPDLRGGPHGGPQRVPAPHRPGEPGQAGRPQDHEQGGAAQRRRLRLAPSEPQRRRGRRAAAAVPVRRGRRPNR